MLRTADAYSYTTFQVYVRDDDSNYGYRQMTFQFGNWYGSLTALQTISSSARIVGPYAYSGWSIGGGPSWIGADFPVVKSNSDEDPYYYQDSSHSWVTVYEAGFSDLKDLGTGVRVWSVRCGNENYCASWPLALAFGATVRAETAQGYTYAWMDAIWFPGYYY